MFAGWLQNVFAALLGGAVTAITAAGLGAPLKVVGGAAVASAASSVLHLNVRKNP